MSPVAETQLEAQLTRVRVRHLAPNAVRITHAPAGEDSFPPDRPWLEHVLQPVRPIPASESHLVVESTGGCIRVRSRTDDFTFAEVEPARVNVHRRARSVTLDIPNVEIRHEVDETDAAAELAFAIEPGEGFYGWGEWFNAFRRERGQVRLHIRDALAILQHRETYSAIPVYYSSRGYALWLLNSFESTWSIEPERGRLRVEAAGPNLDYILIYGPAFRDILRTYTALTGRPPLLPRWAYGLMVTGYPQEAQAAVVERAEEHRRRAIPLDAIILDYHWEERYHNFRWRRSLFPNPEALIRQLAGLGVRLGLIFTPFLNSRNRPGQRRLLHVLAHNLAEGCEHDDECALPEYRVALERGYLAHPEAGWWFGAGGMLDFSNPDATAWWNNRLRPLYEQGIAFFKNDDGEYLPPDGQSALGMSGREYHNLYGFFYGRAIYQGMQALDQRRGFIYARTVWVGSQRFPALFLGDQKPTFKHIRSTLRAGLNLGLLGFAYWTADVFGLDGKTTPELHRRYAQWALLVPVARYFWRPPAVDDTRFPWSHGPANEANFRTYTELRYRLLPYYYALSWEAYQTGLPVLRPMLLEYPDDARFADVSDQALLGDRLLLAPILTAGDPATGHAVRRVRLPAGLPWHDLWSLQTYPGGGDVEYTAAPDRLPLFVRGGSILPMGPVLQHIPDDHRFDSVEFHCWPPYPAEAVLYDDDGRTRAYEAGACSLTRVTAEGSEVDGRVTVRIAAAEGAFPEQVPARRVQVWLHRSEKPAAVAVHVDGVVDDQSLEWRYEVEQQAVVVALECSVDRAATITIAYAERTASGRGPDL